MMVYATEWVSVISTSIVKTKNGAPVCGETEGIRRT